MIRFSSLSASLVASTLLFSATATQAQPTTGFYAAKPVAAAQNLGKLVVRDTIWNCTDAGCFANAKGSSRPQVMCESLAKEVGKLESFRAGGVEFNAEALAACNTKA